MASVLLLVLAGGCSRTLTVDAPAPSRADARACAALLNALPRRVADQTKRRVDDGSGYAAAWGDPAIELRCGVPRPTGLDRFASCQVANGVGWFIPESQQTGRVPWTSGPQIGRAHV